MKSRRSRSTLVAAASTFLATSTLGESDAGDNAIIAKVEVAHPMVSRFYGAFPIAGQPVVFELEADAMAGTISNLALDLAVLRAAFFAPSSGPPWQPAET